MVVGSKSKGKKKKKVTVKKKKEGESRKHQFINFFLVLFNRNLKVRTACIALPNKQDFSSVYSPVL